MMMRRRQDATAPQYLTAHWTHRRVTYGGRAFAVAGPSTWNSLPKRLRDPSNTVSVFGRLLKTFFFSEY